MQNKEWLIAKCDQQSTNLLCSPWRVVTIIKYTEAVFVSVAHKLTNNCAFKPNKVILMIFLNL